MDLELVETQALIDELLTRFDHCVFSGLRGHEAEKYAVAGFYKGNAFTVAGLAQRAAQRALDDWKRDSEDFDKDDL